MEGADPVSRDSCEQMLRHVEGLEALFYAQIEMLSGALRDLEAMKVVLKTSLARGHAADGA